MADKKRKIIGILGGMGPEATNRLSQMIISCTPASSDQEHIPQLVYNNTLIPDRTEAIISFGKSPVPEMLDSALTLQQAGADFLLVPCNTAHHFIPELQSHLKIPILNMIEETIRFIKQNYPDVKTVGLLATSGTIAAKVYHDVFANYDITILTPSITLQKEVVMDAIYGIRGVKAGFHENPRNRLETIGNILVKQGADAIIAGCTEVSIVLNQENVPFLVIDPVKVVAERAVEMALASDESSIILESVKESKMESPLSETYETTTDIKVTEKGD